LDNGSQNLPSGDAAKPHSKPPQMGRGREFVLVFGFLILVVLGLASAMTKWPPWELQLAFIGGSVIYFIWLATWIRSS
jgi:hypothetical protein